MSEPSTYEEELARCGRIIRTNKGTSMMPLLRADRDVMIIEKRPSDRLKKYEVPLYKDKHGRYILHRILKVRENDYVICGDHCTRREYGITDEHIIGILVGVIRDGKTLKTTDFSYKLYYHLWCDFFYVRVAIIKTKAFLHRCFAFVKRRIFGGGK